MESGLSDFLQQIPTSLIVMLCGSGIALVVSLIVIISLRNRRAQAAAAAPAEIRSPYAPPLVSSYSGGDELPDLETLVTQEIPIVEAPPSRPVRTTTFSVRIADGDELEVVEVLAVLRDVTDGSLLIQIGDRIHRNPPALADTEFKRRFNTTISELAKNLSALPKRPAASAPAAAPPPRPAPPPPTRPGVPLEEARFAPPLPVDEIAPVVEEVAPEMPPEEDLMPPAEPPVPPTRTAGTLPSAVLGDLPKFTLPDKPLQAKPLRRVPKPDREPIPEIDVGGSVESYLQWKLSQSEEFAGRSIHIRSNPKGGITIEVDGRYYEAVSDVEDKEAQAFLRTAIQEWQERQ